MDQVLKLREYESARIGSRWDPERREIPEASVGQIEALQADQRSEILSIGRRHVTARNYVGTVGLESRAIDLLPKIDEPDDAQARSRLVEMLSVGGLVPSLDAGETRLALRAPTLLDAFLSVYVRRLTMEWRRGHIRDYLRRDAARPYLRGKLLFSEHIRRALVRPDRFYTRADEFIEDVPLSRLLKLALETCRGYAVSEETRHSAVELLQDFRGVSDGLSPAQIDAISIDRRTERFRRVVELARAIASRRTLEGAGSRPSYSLVFDMNTVFEAYVGRLMRRLAPALGLAADLQVSGRSLVLRSGQGRFRLRPDIAVWRGGKLLALVDTKWKRLDLDRPHENVSQSDVYQMYAYGREYDCATVVLLYPRFGALPEHVATYHHQPGGSGSRRIEVRTVDVAKETRGDLLRLLAGMCPKEEHRSSLSLVAGPPEARADAPLIAGSLRSI
jgi:5-methylcytosine-specific restriction enzyme subunit McrC